MFRRRKTSVQRREYARSSSLRLEFLENRQLLAGVNAPEILSAGETARYDFGPSTAVVASQMTGVSPGNLFNDSTDFGFDAANSINLKAIERTGVWGDHTRDFAQGRAIAFSMRVDPGLTHDLTFSFGDPFRRRQIEVSVEGAVVGTFDIPKGQLQTPSFLGNTVDDGVLNIIVRATGDRAALMNHLIVSANPGSDPNSDPGNDPDPNSGGGNLPTSQRLDFGTATSSVHSGMTRVTHTDRFGANRDFGLVTQGSVGLASRSRNGVWGDHSRDFVKGDAIAISMRLDPSLNYTLSFGFGDAQGKSRTESVSIEGAVVDQLSIPARRFVSTSYDTGVSNDGVLEIIIRATGSRAALVNFVSAVPVDNTGGGNTGGGNTGGGVPNEATPTSHRLDFGTATSTVKAAMLRVTELNRFDASSDFGFVAANSSSLISRSRNGLWGDHTRDFVKGHVISLSLRLDSSMYYSVSFGFGDATGNATSQSVSIEGVVVDQLQVPGRTLVVADYGSAISGDGILDITIRSTSSRKSLINYLVVLPSSPPAPSASGCDVGADHTTSASDSTPAWLDLFPATTAPNFGTASQEISCSQQFTPGTNWAGLDERQVFANRLTLNDSNQQATHEYRIGEGSQLYSLRARDDSGQWIEAVGSQRAGHAEWIDEVIQSVLVDTATNDRSSESTKNQIHQSGTYRNLSGPTFYSPVLAESWQPDDRSFSTINWPQQAHIPSNFKSHFLQMQQVRDLGSGVLEVTYVFHNFSQEGERADFLAAPWLPVRDSSYPFQFRSLPDGRIQRDQREWCVNCTSGIEQIDESGGYFLFSSGTDALDPAFAIVFGDDSDDDGQRTGSRFRWGTVTSGGRDVTAASVQKLVTIGPGEVYYTRFFVVANTMRDTRAMARQLSGHVSQGYLDAELSTTTDACLTLDSGQLSAESCAVAGTNSLATMSTTPRRGWQPLMVLRESTTGQHFVTNDPYELSRRPYTEVYTAEELLGWVSPATLADLALISDPNIADQLVLVE